MQEILEENIYNRNNLKLLILTYLFINLFTKTSLFLLEDFIGWHKFDIIYKRKFFISYLFFLNERDFNNLFSRNISNHILFKGFFYKLLKKISQIYI